MAQITSTDFKNGKTLLLDGVLFQIVEFQHVKPGKGHAFVRTKLRNVESGGVVDKTFRPDEKVEQAVIERSEMQYLYRDGDDYVFMDSETYDQVHVPATVVGDQGGFIKDGSTAVIPFHEGRALGVELPAAVVLEVTETEPGVKGDRVSGATKPATLETGITVAVPLFVETGTRIKVDTRECTYLSRET
ncbi:MAG: elongation factor P [Acidimicrobiia bacterium]